ncbi:hypothetical protein JA1_003068 [Spathaspora sp. JA1]|nr:hypothetical protein JA1_003068 [Spathaspora sp. JA1]
MRREYGWSKVGEKAVVETPVTKGVNVSVLGAISSKGCIDLKVRNPAGQSRKKRKIGSDTSVSESKGTTANHFYQFIKSVAEQIKSNKELNKLKYLVLDNAPIHLRRDIQLLVASAGLQLVFLPPYSPCLNAIEEFWAVCKSKVKRSNLSKREELTPRIREATSKITVESYEGFCSHAREHIQPCLKRESF